jgi:hypothetical protein
MRLMFQGVRVPTCQELVPFQERNPLERGTWLPRERANSKPSSQSRLRRFCYASRVISDNLRPLASHRNILSCVGAPLYPGKQHCTQYAWKRHPLRTLCRAILRWMSPSRHALLFVGGMRLRSLEDRLHLLIRRSAMTS